MDPLIAERMGDRPYRGLFGAGGSDPNIRHSLEFSFSFTEAYDDDVPTGLNPGFVGNAVDNVVVGGYSTMLLGDAMYHRRVSTWDIGASLSDHEC